MEIESKVSHSVIYLNALVSSQRNYFVICIFANFIPNYSSFTPTGQLPKAHTSVIDVPNHPSSKKREQTLSLSSSSSSSSLLQVQPVVDRNVQQTKAPVTVDITNNALYSNDVGMDG